jgi:transcriptional regulator with XRE-family HTH domain
MNKERAVNPLRGRRAALGLSQPEVASRMGKSPSWLSLIENGHYIPTEDEKNRLAAILDCGVAEIFPAQAA